MDDDSPTIDERGLLQRDGGGFVLRRDGGGLYRLRLSRVPVDHVEKRVRIVGRLEDETVEVEGLYPGG